MSRAIVTCCYSTTNREYYASYYQRLQASLEQFSKNAAFIAWRNEWPPHCPEHLVYPYAFKYYAVKDAFQNGYRYVMWLDAGTKAIASIEPLWKRIEEYGYALLAGTDELSKWISDYALEKFGYTRARAKELKLAGGCLVGLDSQNPKAMEFFAIWGELVRDRRLLMGANRKAREIGGIMRSLMLSDADESIISDDPTVEGHRSDESCFSLIMDKLGMEPINYTAWQEVCKTY